MAVTEKLLKLYRVDAQIRGLRSRVEQSEAYLSAQTKKWNDLQRLRSELQAQNRQLQANIANLEMEAKAKDDRINTLREQMNQAKTNKQYSALLLELNTLKVDKDKLETQALEEMTRVDKIKTQIEEYEKQIADREKIKSVAENEVKDRRGEIAQRLEELEREQSAAKSEVPAEALNAFKTAADLNEGDPMAEIVEEDRRRMEFSCGACNIQLPVEKVSRILSRGELISCPSCRRILYMGEEIRVQYEKKLAAKS